MRPRLLLAAAAALTLAACSDSSTSPRLSPNGPSREITCRSGYHIATRDDGSESCEPDTDGFFAAPASDAPGATPPNGASPVAAPPASAPPVALPPAVPTSVVSPD